MTGSLLIIPSALAPPDEIRRKAQEVISRPDYELESADPESLGIFARILRWILETLQAFFDAMAGLPDFLRWIVVAVLLIVLAVLVGHIVYTFVRALRGIPRRQSASFQREETMTPEELESAANEAHAQGDHIRAVRFLFSASLLRIERAEERPIRKGITNRELLRRYRPTPLFGPLSLFVDVIDAKWYGHDVCRAEDYLACRDEHARIRGIAERSRHALRA